jgi:hypothetical protein
MALILDGTNGLSDVDGSAATPAIRGSDANTGVFFGTDIVGVSTGGSERVRVDASGNVGIGTSSPGAKLDNLQSANSSGFRHQQTNATNTATAFVIDCSRNTTDGTYAVIQYFNSGAGANKFIMQDSGNLLNSNNSYGALSDVKLKENIVDASPKLDKLTQVRVVNYNLKTDPDQKLLGVIAQELEQIFPGMVEESPDRDAEGNDLGTTTKSVKYSVFVPMLIKAIQEQQAIITALTARVEALEGAQ